MPDIWHREYAGYPVSGQKVSCPNIIDRIKNSDKLWLHLFLDIEEDEKGLENGSRYNNVDPSKQFYTTKAVNRNVYKKFIFKSQAFL